MAEKKSFWTKQVDPNSKSSKRLKSFFGFILIAYIVVFVIKYSINKFALGKKDIYEKIGNGVSVSIHTLDAYKIKEYSIKRYANYILKNDYESAYNMLSDEYRAYYDIDGFKEQIQGIDFSTIDMKDIKAKSDYCYIANVEFKRNGELVETTYILYSNEYNTESFTISPDKFLCSYRNQDFKKDGIHLHIDSCLVYIDEIKLVGTISNESWFSDMEFNGIDISYGYTMNSKKDLNLSLKKDESAPIDVTFSGFNFFIPNNVKLERVKDEKSISTYSFYFLEEKAWFNGN